MVQQSNARKRNQSILTQLPPEDNPLKLEEIPSSKKDKKQDDSKKKKEDADLSVIKSPVGNQVFHRPKNPIDKPPESKPAKQDSPEKGDGSKSTSPSPLIQDQLNMQNNNPMAGPVQGLITGGMIP